MFKKGKRRAKRGKKRRGKRGSGRGEVGPEGGLRSMADKRGAWEEEGYPLATRGCVESLETRGLAPQRASFKLIPFHRVDLKGNRLPDGPKFGFKKQNKQKDEQSDPYFLEKKVVLFTTLCNLSLA